MIVFDRSQFMHQAKRIDRGNFIQLAILKGKIAYNHIVKILKHLWIQLGQTLLLFFV